MELRRRADGVEFRLHVRPRAVELLSGHRSRRKWVAVRGEPETLSSGLARLAHAGRVV